jgi:hypothetical protein
MKAVQTIKTLALSSLLISGAVMAQPHTCCLAEEWSAGEVPETRVSQAAAADCQSKADSLSCCLADVWVVDDRSAVATPQQALAAEEFCCIAEEWVTR